MVLLNCMNQSPAFIAPVLSGMVMLSCSIDTDQAMPRDVDDAMVVDIHCPKCPEAGIRSIDLHHGMDVRQVSLTGWGDGYAEFDLWEFDEYGTWLSAGGVPLLVNEGFQEGDYRFFLYAEPADWGPNPGEDTILSGHVHDPDPVAFQWESALYDANSFGPRMAIRFSIHPDSAGRFEVSLPRIYARKHPDQSARILHTIMYRGAPFRSDTLPGSVLSPSWPPPVGDHFPPPNLVEHQPDGTIIHTLVYRRPDSTWSFRRSHTLDAIRIREDSGTWNHSTGRADYLVRAPGIVDHRDSTMYAPRPILVEHREGFGALWATENSVSGSLSQCWWREGEPRLHSALQTDWRFPTLRFFQ